MLDRRPRQRVVDGRVRSAGVVPRMGVVIRRLSMVLARGLRDMFFLVPVAQWALTTQRLVAMGGPGVARSLWFETLVHKPLVIPRSENTATFALELRKLVSAGMLPMRGLWGVDEMNREQAESWARAVIAGRDKTSKGSA